MEWPDWWSWELKFSGHLLKRMVDREFNEPDFQLMLDRASDYYENREPDRWVIETRHVGEQWEIIVEPLIDEQVLFVITAYPVK